MISVDISFERGSFALEAAFDAGSGITAIFGPSGSGKSTLLHLIAGLLRPRRGRIEIDGEMIVDAERRLFIPAHRRRIGYVFQDGLLFPHLSVRRNLEYGRQESDEGRFTQIVELLGLASLLGRRPTTLSGGERQRVAIGRALLSSPRLLLMDEPLAALDIDRKRELIAHVENIPKTLKIPILYVSHAIEEVVRLADAVMLIEGGHLASPRPPSEVLKVHAADRFAQVSMLTARRVSYDSRYGLTSFHHPSGMLTVAGQLGSADETVRILIKATDVTLSLNEPRGLSARTALKGTIAEVGVGRLPIVFADIALNGGERLAVALTRKAVDELGLGPGDGVWCLIKAVSIDERLLPAP
jgi:molybdate transport system ATP-binding protein